MESLFSFLMVLPICKSHMSMQFPYPRDNGGTYAKWQANEPMITVHPQVCHGLEVDESVRSGNAFAAGDTITIDLYGTVPHGGGHCTFWYSTDDAVFTKIIDIKDCTLAATTQVTLPETMATECQEKCTFAWSWVPAQSGACEIYMSCADISVSGAVGGDPNPITKNFQTEIIDQGTANGYGCQRVDDSTHWTSIFMPLKTEYDGTGDSGSTGSGSVTPSPTVPTSRVTPSPVTPSGNGNGILISNRAGGGAWWYMITLSDVPSGIEIESVYMRDSYSSATWEQGKYEQWGDYYTFSENTPYAGPFDFRIVSTSGLVIESMDVVEDYVPGKSGRMTEFFDSAFSMENGVDSNNTAERSIFFISVFGALWCAVCVVAGLCIRRRKRRASLNQMENMATSVDESHQIAEIEVSVVDLESEDDTMKPIGVQ